VIAAPPLPCAVCGRVIAKARTHDLLGHAAGDRLLRPLSE
jgi:hypothetical protein